MLLLSNPNLRHNAREPDAQRKRQKAEYATLTLTDLYNVVEKLKAGEALTAKDQIIHQQGLASVVLSLHWQLDAAVAEAYGWSDGLPESEVLTCLVRLNHERAAEEQSGHIRYLRPSYQAPESVQMGLNLPVAEADKLVSPAVPESAVQREWPKELAAQMQALRDLVQQTGEPLATAQIAAQFIKLKTEKVQPLLDTLKALALLRQTESGAYMG